MRVLDRSFFHKSIPTSAARVHNPRDISRVQKECASDLLRLKRVAPVQEDPEVKGRKLILLWPEVRYDGMEFLGEAKRASFFFWEGEGLMEGGVWDRSVDWK